jgi:L-serine deaminase
MAINTFSELLKICAEEKKPISKIAQQEEAIFLEITEDMVRIKVLETLMAMKDAVKNGL